MSLGNMEKTHLYKNTKISWVWHCMPVVQLLRRLKQENRLKLGGRGCSGGDCTIAFQPGDRVRLHLKKKKKILSVQLPAVVSVSWPDVTASPVLGLLTSLPTVLGVEHHRASAF